MRALEGRSGGFGLLRSSSTLVAMLALAACGSDDSPDRQRLGSPPPAPVVTDTPETTFAPLVHLSSSERLFPLSAREFIDNSTARGTGAGRRLDLRADTRDGHPALGHDVGYAVLRDVPVYVESEPAAVEGRQGLRLTYWMLYGFDSGTRREGDWERIGVVLRATTASDRYEPVLVSYTIDGDQVEVAADDVGWASGGEGRATHPMAYAALGSHTPYPKPGTKGAKACTECPRWRTWQEVLDLHAERWWGYRGAWGSARGPQPRG